MSCNVTIGGCGFDNVEPFDAWNILPESPHVICKNLTPCMTSESAGPHRSYASSAANFKVFCNIS